MSSMYQVININWVVCYCKDNRLGVGEVAWWLVALTALAEDRLSAHGTHMVSHQHQFQGIGCPLLLLVCALATMRCTY